jgi:hypothetical protein
MGQGWKCPRCGTGNDDVGITCKQCGSSRGSVVIPGATAMEPRAGPNDGAAAVSGQTAAPPLWRRIPLGWLLFLGLIAFGAVSSWYFSAGRSDSGEITKSGDLAVNELRVGDCFDLKDPDAEVLEDVSARPCTEEHQYETFFVGSMADGGYPTDAAFEAYVTANCDPAFEAYVGRAFEDSQLAIGWVGPSLPGWNDGDRSVQCVLDDPGSPRLTASMKGSNR